jgi:hypothetical protein
MCTKDCWNDQRHNDNTTRMTKYKFIDYYGKSPKYVVEEEAQVLHKIASVCNRH